MARLLSMIALAHIIPPVLLLSAGPRLYRILGILYYLNIIL